MIEEDTQHHALASLCTCTHQHEHIHMTHNMPQIEWLWGLEVQEHGIGICESLVVS